MNKNKTTLLAFIFSFGLVISQAAQANLPELQVQCGHDEQNGVGWNYCDHQLPGSLSQDVLYYFHGLHGSEMDWQSSPVLDKIYTLWGQSAPRVVTISYGTAWLLAEKNGSPASGLYEHFIHAALPYLENQLKLKPAHRLLMGLSMGGFNASQVYLKNPELFTKVALACPAITDLSPYGGTDAINAYQCRTGANSANIDNALALSSYFFPTAQDWNRSAPVDLARKLITPAFPDLYVSGGTEDEYGFQEGAKAFAEIASANGAKSTWVALPGPHCVFDVSGTAQFLISP